MDEKGSRLACHHLSLPATQLLNALSQYGSAASLLEAEPASLAQFFLTKDLQRLEQWQSLNPTVREDQLSGATKTIRRLNASLLSITDENYPPLLRQIPDPPPLLSVIGDMSKLAGPQIAIVGSRKMTPLGGKLAEDFAKQLGSAGITITSGLALGVDTCAHQGALSVGADTVAVLGTGIDGRYPRSNAGLYQNIVEAGGVLVSEYPLGTPPRAANFPRRNRIITGLSMGTLVVEASEKSGSLVSARLAAEQGREVFALPGSVYSPTSAGCHRLVREGATLVTKPEHVLEGIGSLFGVVIVSEPHENRVSSNLGEKGSGGNPKEFHWLLNALGHECLSIDELCDRCERPVQEVTAAVTHLEINGAISASAFGYQRLC